MNFGLQILILSLSILISSALGATVGGVLLLRKQQSDVIKELIFNAQQGVDGDGDVEYDDIDEEDEVENS